MEYDDLKHLRAILKYYARECDTDIQYDYLRNSINWLLDVVDEYLN